MKDTKATAPRLDTLSRLVLALAVALVLGAVLIPSVNAVKKGKNTIASVKDRVKAQRDMCELIGGGTLSVSTTPFGATITDCKGGADDERHCVNTKQSTKCSLTLTVPTAGGATIGEPAGGVAVASLDGSKRDKAERSGKRHQH